MTSIGCLLANKGFQEIEGEEGVFENGDVVVADGGSQVSVWSPTLHSSFEFLESSDNDQMLQTVIAEIAAACVAVA